MLLLLSFLLSVIPQAIHATPRWQGAAGGGTLGLPGEPKELSESRSRLKGLSDVEGLASWTRLCMELGLENPKRGRDSRRRAQHEQRLGDGKEHGGLCAVGICFRDLGDPW